jgi:hypothetical protein
MVALSLSPSWPDCSPVASTHVTAVPFCVKPSLRSGLSYSGPLLGCLCSDPFPHAPQFFPGLGLTVLSSCQNIFSACQQQVKVQLSAAVQQPAPRFSLPTIAMLLHPTTLWVGKLARLSWSTPLFHVMSIRVT